MTERAVSALRYLSDHQRPFCRGASFGWCHPAENVPRWGCLPEDWLLLLLQHNYPSEEAAVGAAEAAFERLPVWRQADIRAGVVAWVPRLDYEPIHYTAGWPPPRVEGA